MKVVLLAGGYGTRISEESQFKPKPMIEIGGMPILWHIMKEYAYYGYTDFVVCAGYKQHVIKEWFADYFLHTSDITFDFTQGNRMIVHNQHAEPWKVTVVDTGLNTMTGGRIKRTTRPYQHVLEPLFAYLMIAMQQAKDRKYAGWYNVGPDECDCVTTGELVNLFCKKWGEGAQWENQAEANAPHEASFLKLDCSRIKSVFGWRPRWHIEEAIKQTCRWSKAWIEGENVAAEMDREINEFMEEC